MSEFISLCPKCRQRITCDTQYVGHRVACPLCLQEIEMPDPRTAISAIAPVSHARPEAPMADAGTRRHPLFWGLVVGGVVGLALAAGAAVWAMQDHRPEVAALAKNPVLAPTVAASASTAPSTPLAARRDKTPRRGKKVAIDECSAQWTFDADQGSTAMDCSSNGYNATLVGEQATWTTAAKVGGGALSLLASSYAQTEDPAVDTTKSFTVTAWVSLDSFDNKHSQTIVSIDGNEVSGFALQFNHTTRRFAFARFDADDRNATLFMAKATSSIVPHIWYHLAGVYDAGANTLSLYVDGKPQETAPFTKPWAATGRTAIGRGYFGHTKADFFNGIVDEVHIYPSALSAAQIRSLAR